MHFISFAEIDMFSERQTAVTINASAILLIEPYKKETCKVTTSALDEYGQNKIFKVVGNYEYILLKLSESK